jgi:hypothetical protein
MSSNISFGNLLAMIIIIYDQKKLLLFFFLVIKEKNFFFSMNEGFKEKTINGKRFISTKKFHSYLYIFL